jgi:hypothetical protein
MTVVASLISELACPAKVKLKVGIRLGAQSAARAARP